MTRAVLVHFRCAYGSASVFLKSEKMLESIVVRHLRHGFLVARAYAPFRPLSPSLHHQSIVIERPTLALTLKRNPVTGQMTITVANLHNGSHRAAHQTR